MIRTSARALVIVILPLTRSGQSQAPAAPGSPAQEAAPAAATATIRGHPDFLAPLAQDATAFMLVDGEPRSLELRLIQ